jgi:hypothetical protein
MCRALPLPSVRLRPVDKILRGGGHPCTRICDRAMTLAVIHGQWSLRADTSVRVKWQPQPKQYADARGRSQSKSVLLPYQASGQDQWISSSGGEDGCVEHYPYQASGYDQRIRSSMGGRPSVK